MKFLLSRYTVYGAIVETSRKYICLWPIIVSYRTVHDGLAKEEQCHFEMTLPLQEQQYLEPQGVTEGDQEQFECGIRTSQIYEKEKLGGFVERGDK
jgi:hypothetical protein